jgi:hypothetical protein
MESEQDRQRRANIMARNDYAPAPASTPEAERHITERSTVKVSVATAEEVLHRSSESTPSSPPPSVKKTRTAVSRSTVLGIAQITSIILLVIMESGLVTISLVPGTKAASLGWNSAYGPFPEATAPLVTAIFYLAPFAIGLLARKWEVALVGATFPAWLSIGIFAVFAATRDGIFYMTSNAHPTYLVGTMELFAVLGGFGWLMRRVLLGTPA